MPRTSEERRQYQRQWARDRYGHHPQQRPNTEQLAEINRLLKLRETHRIIAERTGWSKALIDKISCDNKAGRARARKSSMRRLAMRLLAADWSYALIRLRTRLSINTIGKIHSMLDALLEED